MAAGIPSFDILVYVFIRRRPTRPDFPSKFPHSFFVFVCLPPFLSFLSLFCHRRKTTYTGFSCAVQKDVQDDCATVWRCHRRLDECFGRANTTVNGQGDHLGQGASGRNHIANPEPCKGNDAVNEKPKNIVVELVKKSLKRN